MTERFRFIIWYIVRNTGCFGITQINYLINVRWGILLHFCLIVLSIRSKICLYVQNSEHKWGKSLRTCDLGSVPVSWLLTFILYLLVLVSLLVVSYICFHVLVFLISQKKCFVISEKNVTKTLKERWHNMVMYGKVIRETRVDISRFCSFWALFIQQVKIRLWYWIIHGVPFYS